MIMRLLSLAASVAAVLIVPLAVQGETITLDAVQDTKCVYYEDGSTAGRGLNYDGQQLWIGRVTTPKYYYELAVYQFDLSSLPGQITSAHIELYDLGTSSWQADAFAMENYLVTPNPEATDEQLVVAGYEGNNAFDKDGMHEEAMTYTAYAAAAAASWVESSTVMSLNIEANTPAGWHSSLDADSDLLDTLNANRTGKGYAVVLGWYKKNGGLRIFGDREEGHAPRLVVESVPEPSTVILLALAGLALAARRP